MIHLYDLNGKKGESIALWLLVIKKNDDFYERIKEGENKLIRLRYFEWIVENRSYVKNWSKKMQVYRKLDRAKIIVYRWLQ